MRGREGVTPTWQVLYLYLECAYLSHPQVCLTVPQDPQADLGAVVWPGQHQPLLTFSVALIPLAVEARLGLEARIVVKLSWRFAPAAGVTWGS